MQEEDRKNSGESAEELSEQYERQARRYGLGGNKR